MEVRPLSAHPELTIPLPGPQDYNIVNTDIYLKNKSVIRKMTFPQGPKMSEPVSKSLERIESPSP